MRSYFQMRKIKANLTLAGGLVLVLMALLTACGDATSTAAPNSGAMMQATTAAMAKETPGAMTAKETPGAMMPGTTGAMMPGTTAAMMAKETPGAMMGGMTSLNGMFDQMSGPMSVSGAVKVAEDSASKKYQLIITGLKVTGSGSNLHVWYSKEADPAKLTTADQVKSGLDLGPLKATAGDSTYPLDASIDVTQYKSVVIFDNTANSVFGAAPLTKAK